MRFNDDNYRKAFPREDKPVKQESAPAGSVIEEAEKQEVKKTIKESEPDSVIDDAAEPEQEGSEDDGNE